MTKHTIEVSDGVNIEVDIPDTISSRGFGDELPSPTDQVTEPVTPSEDEVVKRKRGRPKYSQIRKENEERTDEERTNLPVEFGLKELRASSGESKSRFSIFREEQRIQDTINETSSLGRMIAHAVNVHVGEFSWKDWWYKIKAIREEHEREVPCPDCQNIQELINLRSAIAGRKKLLKRRMVNLIDEHNRKFPWAKLEGGSKEDETDTGVAK